MVVTISEAGQRILDSVKQLAPNNPPQTSNKDFPFTFMPTQANIFFGEKKKTW